MAFEPGPRPSGGAEPTSMSRCYFNGRLIRRTEAYVSADDAGFLFGDGVFETLRVDAGVPRGVDLHLDRLYGALDRVDLQIPEERAELARAIRRVAESTPYPVAMLRLTVSRGPMEHASLEPCGRGNPRAAPEPTRLISTTAYRPPSTVEYGRGVPTILLDDLRVDADSGLAGIKTLSYQPFRLARQRARSASAYEALMFNQEGRLVAGSRSNLVVVLPAGTFTPPLGDGCLPGTVRRVLLEADAVEERSLTREDLARAREVLLTNSLVGVLPVCRVDGDHVPVGPVAANLQALLCERRGC